MYQNYLKKRFQIWLKILSMEIKEYIDHLQFGKFFVYVIDSKGNEIRRHEHSGNTDIYFVSADN